MSLINVPSPEEVRRRRKARSTAENRRDHFIKRIAAAPRKQQKLAEAFDYLRAAVRDDQMDQAISELVAMADRMGGIR